ncbi:MAG: glycosyhydrolase [Rhizobiaceae bacterium MnEN-MB40S]|nr:MAG: glycosyhydrolase [Rhizobiaceae bacterium MnEN-MB40S]
MYASHGFLRSDIGDVDIVCHEGVYHLFHLVLPNHDFIAHAVSKDGMAWNRVRNALFVGEPGEWDDDMLWTMHVSPDPEKPGSWRMFYTGLSRAEFGRVQRVGLARSDDLYHWKRCDNGNYPLEIDGRFYESSADEGRKWVSFRDPFFYRDEESGERLLLSSARINEGPIIRRGCVGLAREVEPDVFVFDKPLHRPGLYDDIEVPNLIRIKDRYFLLGSIREDTKVHYWWSDGIEGPYENFYDNVLLPEGNYAARICCYEGKYLLFNFFSRKETLYGRDIITRLLPPPKEIVSGKDGRLHLKSFSGFDALVCVCETISDPGQISMLFDNPHARVEDLDDGMHILCPSGYEAFLLPGLRQDFRLRARMELAGLGKCGMVIRVSEEGDGYYLSLDLVKGIAQIRHWGANPTPEFEHAFTYQTLQTGYFLSNIMQGGWEIEIVCHGMYLELSINGQVTLSLVDDGFHEGHVGFYTESANLKLDDVVMQSLSRPTTEQDSVYTATRPVDAEIIGPGPASEL